MVWSIYFTFGCLDPGGLGLCQAGGDQPSRRSTGCRGPVVILSWALVWNYMAVSTNSGPILVVHVIRTIIYLGLF